MSTFKFKLNILTYLTGLLTCKPTCFVHTACSEMEFSHVRISGAEVAIDSSSTTMLLRHVTIDSNIRGIRTADGATADFRIEDSLVSNNEFDGLYIRTQENVFLVRTTFKNNNVAVRCDKLSKLEVTDCDFVNRNAGIFGNGVLSHVHVYNTTFADDIVGLSLNAASASEMSSITIDGCSFLSSRRRYRGALYLIMNNYAYNATVSDCIFRENSRGVYLYGTNARSTALFKNVTLVHNTYEAIYLQVDHPVVIRDSAFAENRNTINFARRGRQVGSVLLNNTFIANAGDYVVSLRQLGQNFVVSNSTFENNTATSTVIIDSSKDTHFRCTHNAFINPQATFELKIETAWADKYTIDARHNWWGTTNATAIRYRIWDFFQDFTRAEVILSQVFGDLSMDANNIINVTAGLRINGNILGGRLEEDTVLTLDTLTIVDLTIHVPRGRKLIINTNGTLQFKQKTGVFVQGKLYKLNTHAYAHKHIHTHARTHARTHTFHYILLF